MLPKLGKDPKFSQNVCPINLFYTTDKLFEKVILKIVQKYTEERGLLNACKFGFHARHITALRFMRLTNHVTLNFNSSISTAAVFLDNEKPLISHGTLAYYIKLSKLEFSASLIKLVTSFLSQRKFRVSVEGEMCAPRDIRTRVPEVSFLSPTLCNIYINDTP
jgi:hypothetical protein